MPELLPHTLCIKRFKPPAIFMFDPDAPITYEPTIPKENICTTEDVIRLGDILYKAEYEAWRGKQASEILETMIDGGVCDLLATWEYLTKIGTREALEHRQKLMNLAIRWKSPLASCILQSLESIFIKDGEEAVHRAIEKLTKEKDAE